MGSKLRNRFVIKILAGVVGLMFVLWLNAPPMEPSGAAPSMAIRAFGSICIAALSLFLIASALKAVEAVRLTSAGDQKQNALDGEALR